MIELRDDDRGLWQAALTRAIEHGTKPIRGAQLREGLERRLTRETWWAPSYSDPGRSHLVAVNFDGDDPPRATGVKCECLAGLSGQPCHHAAAVLEARGAWPWPMGRQQRMEGL